MLVQWLQLHIENSSNKSKGKTLIEKYKSIFSINLIA